jgi:hypothetical protein
MTAGSTAGDWLFESACKIFSDYEFQTSSKRRCLSLGFILRKMKLQASKGGQEPQPCSNMFINSGWSESSRGTNFAKVSPRVRLPLVVAEYSMREACSASSLLNVILCLYTFM